MSRKGKSCRKTKETAVSVNLEIEGSGKSAVEMPVGFFAHMLESFSRHGLFDLEIRAQGDLKVDQHHLIEDTGLVLGRAFSDALGDKKGISRTGYFVFPMDEALAVAAVDISGRPFLQYEAQFKRRFCGDLDTDLLEDFFRAFAAGLGANIVVRMPFGRSDHHKMEAVFKAFGRALSDACALRERASGEVPSTKGVIDENRNN